MNSRQNLLAQLVRAGADDVEMCGVVKEGGLGPRVDRSGDIHVSCDGVVDSVAHRWGPVVPEDELACAHSAERGEASDVWIVVGPEGCVM